jgi:ricin-type beta-trefoil lectin protein
MHTRRITSGQRTVLPGRRGRAAGLAAAAASAALMVAASPAMSSTLPGFSYSRPVEVTNSASGLRADVMWASTAPSAGVFLWPDNASRSQEFDALGTRGGVYFRLRARHSGLCLALDNREPTYRNGTAVVQRPCNAALQSSYWRVRPVGDRVTCDGDTCTTTSAVYPTLQNRYTNRCLDARNPRGGRPPRQAVLQQWTCIGTGQDWNAGNQLFSVRNVR